jgi:hypothetical protein
MKNIKLAGFEIPFKDILCFKIGNKKYNRLSYAKTKFKGEDYNTFYNILKRNVDKINYILVENYISYYNKQTYSGLRYITNQIYDAGILELYLEENELHNLTGYAYSLNNTVNYYIHGVLFTYEDWSKMDMVVQAQRREKLNRVLNG